ncbi:MAG: efflux RND transporter permease subunit, partial [Thermodesulfobacteriota bacterium]
MRGAVRWMAGNGVAANLLMMIFIVGGILMGYTVKQEIFPEILLDKVMVTVPYPGAGPEEVEEGIVLKIEESISGISGVKEVRSVASEGAGVVTAEVLPGEDTDQVMQDIKAEVDRITTFPREAERPVITKLVNRIDVISVVVYGDIPERSLREYAEEINDDLLAMPEITQAALAGVRPYEISIEVPEENLRGYGLTLDAIAARVRRASVDLPAGTVKSAGGEVLLRTKEKRYHGPEYAGVTILENPDGSEVRLGDIAAVRDTFAETDEFAKLDGERAALVTVFRVGGQKPTEISRMVRGYVEAKARQLPPSVKITTFNDTSEMLKSRMNLLLKNA